MSKLREAARGQECTLEIPGHCNHDPETVVGCHLDSEFKGMALKSPDILIVHGCSGCHAALDQHKVQKEDREFFQLRALKRTLVRLVSQGIIRV